MPRLRRKTEWKFGLKLNRQFSDEIHSIVYETKADNIFLSNFNIITWETVPEGMWILFRVSPAPLKYRELTEEYLDLIDTEFFDLFIDQLTLEPFENIPNKKITVLRSTYALNEIFTMLWELDEEGIALLQEVLTEEEHSYTLTERERIGKAIRFREMELIWSKKKQGGRS